MSAQRAKELMLESNLFDRAHVNHALGGGAEARRLHGSSTEAAMSDPLTEAPRKPVSRKLVWVTPSRKLHGSPAPRKLTELTPSRKLHGSKCRGIWWLAQLPGSFREGVETCSFHDGELPGSFREGVGIGGVCEDPRRMASQCGPGGGRVH